jgi:hypothetical protein
VGVQDGLFSLSRGSQLSRGVRQTQEDSRRWNQLAFFRSFNAAISPAGGVVVVQCWAAWDAALDRKCTVNLAEAARRCQVTHVCRSHNSDDPEWFEDMRGWAVGDIPAVVVLRHGVPVETVIGIRPVEEYAVVLGRVAAVGAGPAAPPSDGSPS